MFGGRARLVDFFNPSRSSVSHLPCRGHNMRCLHWVVSVSLVLTIAISATCAEPTPRLKAFWHQKEARVVVFSPDGRAVVSSGGEGYQLRDSATGRVRAELAGPGVQCNGVSFSPDARLLYAEVQSNEFNPVAVQDLKVWDVATGELKTVFPHVTEAVLDAGHFTLSADDSRLAFQDNSERRPIQVELSEGSWGMLGTSVRSHVVALNVSPGLPRVKIWDVARWRQIAVIDGASPLAFSPDGKTLVTGDRDWKVPVARVWDAATGRLIRVLNDRSPGVWPITVSPGGRFLTSGSFEDRSLWDLADGRRWRTKGGLNPASGV